MSTSRKIVAVGFGHYEIQATAALFFANPVAGSNSKTAVPVQARCFKGRIETASLRIRIDGTDPTPTIGELLDTGDDILLDDHMMAVGKLIRNSATNAIIQGHFYNIEANVFVGGG